MLLNFADAAPKTKSVCGDRELARKDCRLVLRPYEIRMTQDTITWFDGTWRTVDDLPLKGEGVEWQKARFEILNGAPILQLWLWDPGQGETKVQSLHWYVTTARDRKLRILAEGVVRKRRQKVVNEDSDKHQFIYDAMEPHSLKAVKGALEWKLRNETKRMESGDGI